MTDRIARGDAAENLLERRWFASISAVRTLQAECDILREVMEQTEASWQCARSELVRLEALRDALGEELSRRDESPVEGTLLHTDRRLSSAA